MDRKEYEELNEEAVWKISIKMMAKNKDLESLIELRDGPESLSEEIKIYLDNIIKRLEIEIKEK